MPAGKIPDDFLDILRQTFRTGEVSITVEEIPDETAYLLSSTANERDLLDAVEADRRGECYRTMTLDEAEAWRPSGKR
jgi:hypothetical protein